MAWVFDTSSTNKIRRTQVFKVLWKSNKKQNLQKIKDKKAILVDMWTHGLDRKKSID